MTIKEVQKVCFVGAGTMGCFNSLVSAIAGYEVVLYDVSQEILDKVAERHQNWGAVLIEMEFTNQEAVDAALTRVSCTTDAAEAAGDADYLSESVFEKLELKRQVHAQFDKLLPPHAIMTTNTSSLLVSEIGSVVERGDKFAAMHFHQPSPVVDIVGGPQTSPETIDIVKRFVKSQGQVYIYLKKERGGYLHNSLFGAYLGTSLMLATLTGADFKEIDRSWMLRQNSTGGPFATMDHVGLNVMMDAMGEGLDQESGNQDTIIAAQNYLRPYIDRGDLGSKTGKGFYTYPDPEFMQPEFLEGQEENTDYTDAILNAFCSTGMMLVIDDIATLEEVDRCWMLIHQGQLGPFAAMDLKGLDTVLQDLDERLKLYQSMLGDVPEMAENHLKITEFLKHYIDDGKLGEKTGQGFYTYPNPEYLSPKFFELPD